MAEGLATRCPACETVFRVVPDQLRVSDGWVRCGRCSEVFNAGQALVDVETGVARGPTEPAAPAPIATDGTPSQAPWPATDDPPAPESFFERTAVLQPEDIAATVLAEPAAPTAPESLAPESLAPDSFAPPMETSSTEAADATDATDVTSPSDPIQGDAGPALAPGAETGIAAEAEAEAEAGRGNAIDPAVPASDVDVTVDRAGLSAVAPVSAAEAPPEPTQQPLAASPQQRPGPVFAPSGTFGDAPSFVRRAERAARWRRPGVRMALLGLVLAGLLGLAGQVAHVYRDLVAARFPAARPALEQGCRWLGCTVGTARSIDSFTVESSGLLRVAQTEAYQLSVALRNRAGIDLALPAVDLTLTDSQGKLLARRVLRAAELGATQPTLPAGADLMLQATLRSATEPVAGYTIDLFYP